MTMNQIRFVKADAVDDARHVEEVAVFDEDGTPLDPPAGGGGSAEIADGAVTTAKLADDAVTAEKIADGVLPTAATTAKAGLVKQATHVDGASGTVQQIVDALVNAGIMVAS